MVHMAAWCKRRIGLLFVLLALLAALPAYLRAFTITTGSEVPSINIGDTVLVNEVAYAIRVPYSDIRLLRTGSVRRGDMVRLILPDGIHRGFKRVIGLPGEAIELKENRVFINGAALPLQPLNRAQFSWVVPKNHLASIVADEAGHWISFTPGRGSERNCSLVRLGPHEYFLIGDNRDVSADSRIWGPIAEDRILGKVIVTLHAR